jgi:hypothetical protein
MAGDMIPESWALHTGIRTVGADIKAALNPVKALSAI